MERVQAAAGAQPASEQTNDTPAPTAVEAAVAAKDFGSFRAASRAEARGTPLPAPAATNDDDDDDAGHEAPAPAAAAAQPPAADAARPLSNRQQKRNEEIRLAVERATADLRAENDRLTRAAPAPRSDGDSQAPNARAAAPAQPATDDPEPNANDLKKYPGGEYDPKYIADSARWSARDEHRKSEKAAHERAARERYQQVQEQRTTKYHERVQAAVTADATFQTRISNDVAALKPFGALAEGERGGPLNALAELVMDSEIAPDLMLHLSAHPDELQKFAQMPDPYALERAFGRLEQRLEKAAPAPHTPKHIPSAPAPTPTFGSRPAEPTNAIAGSVQRKDFGSFRRAQHERRQAGRSKA